MVTDLPGYVSAQEPDKFVGARSEDIYVQIRAICNPNGAKTHLDIFTLDPFGALRLIEQLSRALQLSQDRLWGKAAQLFRGTAIPGSEKPVSGPYLADKAQEPSLAWEVAEKALPARRLNDTRLTMMLRQLGTDIYRISDPLNRSVFEWFLNLSGSGDLSVNDADILRLIKAGWDREKNVTAGYAKL